MEAAPRARAKKNSWNWLLNFAIIVVVLAAVALAGLLVWARLQNDPEPMRGPGNYPDAGKRIEFGVFSGWEVFHHRGNTEVRFIDDILPRYSVEICESVDMALSSNWNCDNLPVAQMAQAVVPWEATVTYQALPCAGDMTLPVFARVYLTLDDGTDRKAMVVFGPLDGVNWVVARSGPFEEEWPAELVEAMVNSVRTARRRT
jgi:hypothetical protein